MSEQTPFEKDEPEISRRDVINLAKSSVEKIDAEAVRLHQSATKNITAGEAVLRQSLSGQVSADHIDVYSSISGRLQSNTLYMHDSALLVGESGETVIQNSAVGLLYADRATMDNVRARVIVSRQVNGGPIRPVIMLAGKIEGPVEPVMDTPRSLLAGLMAGIAFGMVLWAGRLLSRK
jgi:hypothetical protein